MTLPPIFALSPRRSIPPLTLSLRLPLPTPLPLDHPCAPRGRRVRASSASDKKVRTARTESRLREIASRHARGAHNVARTLPLPPTAPRAHHGAQARVHLARQCAHPARHSRESLSRSLRLQAFLSRLPTTHHPAHRASCACLTRALVRTRLSLSRPRASSPADGPSQTVPRSSCRTRPADPHRPTVSSRCRRSRLTPTSRGAGSCRTKSRLVRSLTLHGRRPRADPLALCLPVDDQTARLRSSPLSTPSSSSSPTCHSSHPTSSRTATCGTRSPRCSSRSREGTRRRRTGAETTRQTSATTLVVSRSWTACGRASSRCAKRKVCGLAASVTTPADGLLLRSCPQSTSRRRCTAFRTRSCSRSSVPRSRRSRRRLTGSLARSSRHSWAKSRSLLLQARERRRASRERRTPHCRRRQSDSRRSRGGWRKRARGAVTG